MQKLEQTTRALNLSGDQTITTSASSAQTTNAVGVSEVLIWGTQDAFVTWGANPTATASSAGSVLLLQGEKLWVQIDPSFKVAALQSSTAGIVHVIPVA